MIRLILIFSFAIVTLNSFSQLNLKAGYDLNYLGDLERWGASHTFHAGVEYILKDHFYFGLMFNHRSIPIKSRSEERRLNKSDNCVKSIREINLSMYTSGAFIDLGYINQVQDKTSLLINLRFRPYNYYRLRTRTSNFSTTEFNSSGNCEDLMDEETVYHSNEKIQTNYHGYEKRFYFPLIPDLHLGVRKKWAEAFSSDFHIGFGLGNLQPVKGSRIVFGFSFVYSLNT